MEKRQLVIAIDFDGTITDRTEDWPNAFKLKSNARNIINKLHDEYNCEIIIWTCRDNSYKDDLDIAKDFLAINDIHYDFINENSKRLLELWKNDSRKVGADIYIDDKAMLGREINWLEIFDYILKFKEKNSDIFIN